MEKSIRYQAYRLIVCSFIIMGIIILCFTQPGSCEQLPDSEITPNNVFSVIELTDRTVDVLLKAKGIGGLEQVVIREKMLKPMHAYQMLVATIDMMIELEMKEGISPMPKVVATPRGYLPADVLKLADMLISHVLDLAHILNIEDYPLDVNLYKNKTPTDVFGKAVTVFSKLGALAGRKAITPSEVYMEMVRAASDVKSILTHIDPAQRYRIDAPVSPSNITPFEVFRETVAIRQDINALRDHFHMEPLPVPEIQENQKLHPTDNFIQTQIIIAELNLLKMQTGTVSATPLPIPVKDKLPSDVHQQAVMVRYLLSQVKTLYSMVSEGNVIK